MTLLRSPLPYPFPWRPLTLCWQGWGGDRSVVGLSDKWIYHNFTSPFHPLTVWLVRIVPFKGEVLVPHWLSWEQWQERRHSWRVLFPLSSWHSLTLVLNGRSATWRRVTNHLLSPIQCQVAPSPFYYTPCWHVFSHTVLLVAKSIFRFPLPLLISLPPSLHTCTLAWMYPPVH